MNSRRKSHFGDAIDHIKNPSMLVREHMEEFFSKTHMPRFPVTRDTSLNEASKELERKVTGLMRAKRQLSSIKAFNEELIEKKTYYDNIKA